MNSVEDDANYLCTRSGFMSQPFRQPHAPPENSILQQHEGFARFLKQHASPPHHRVTAGGRIVPTGPLSPPPMLDFGSLNSFVHGRQANSRIARKDEQHVFSGRQVTDVQIQACSSTAVGGHIPTQKENTFRNKLVHPVSTPEAIYSGNVASGIQPYINPLVQSLPAAVVPLGVLPDGSTLVSCNSVLYQTFWNGTNTIIEPFRAGLAPSVVQAYPAVYPQSAQQGQNYGFGAPPTSNQPERTPLAESSYASLDYKPQTKCFLQDQTNLNENVTLKTRLKDLDKHLALYHFDIGPAERASLVTHRKFLVEEIDKIRVGINSTNSAIPIVASANQFFQINSGSHRSASGNNPATPLNLRSNSQKTQTAIDGTLKKLLSPVAPPFVPGCMQIGSGSIPGSKKKPGNTDASFTSRDTTLVNDFPQDVPNSSRVKVNMDSSSEDQSYKPLDPRDPAMRIIHYDDIEYAARYMYGLTKDTKKYCTTVSEFQETIRQVREQARLHGCAGGSSKDPAYDAEQDIWWAICDRDPIPLPSKTPDHITNPRPWNWNDSPFNVRRRDHSWAEMPPMDARTSPRFQGLTPAEAERSKDTIDVSRSYYALHGKPPSVPFRAHMDDKDNKATPVESGGIRNAFGLETPICSTKGIPSSVRDTNASKHVPSTNEAAAARSLSTVPAAHFSHEKNTESRRHCHSTTGQSEVKTQPALRDSLRAGGHPSAPQHCRSNVQARYDSESEASDRPYQAYVEEATATPLRPHMESTTYTQTAAKMSPGDASSDKLCRVNQNFTSDGKSRPDNQIYHDWHRLLNKHGASQSSGFNLADTNSRHTNQTTPYCDRDYRKENNTDVSSQSSITVAQVVPPSRFAFPGNPNPTKEELGARYRATHGGPPTGYEDGDYTGWDHLIVEESATHRPDRIVMEEWEKIALHGMPVAESKSQWGPDEEAVADDPRYPRFSSGYEPWTEINEK